MSGAHRKETIVCNEFCEFSYNKKIPKKDSLTLKYTLDWFFGLSFWISLPIFLISITKIAYIIPQLFSDAGVVRYLYETRTQNQLITKASDYKNSLQFEILKDIPHLEIVVYGIYPFILLVFFIFSIKVIRLMNSEYFTYDMTKFNWHKISNPELFSFCIKILSISLGILGLLVTIFSIWGAWQ